MTQPTTLPPLYRPYKTQPKVGNKRTIRPTLNINNNFQQIHNKIENGLIIHIAPNNWVRQPNNTTKPAKQYPFKLDPFQTAAIDCIQRSENVLVAAHTSAGKTAVAEYVIALSLQQKQRVIYTSPIKALSNQKYRQLLNEFKDVGLMTGDTTINKEASCLIMTTEILRNMLYRGSSEIREVSWVMFDEIHYMREKERGVIWEEAIIMLPPIINLVFLSATIGNASEFAEWICFLKSRPCNVVHTDVRPVPLQHYIMPKNGNGLYLAVDKNSKFYEKNFRAAINFIQEEPPNKAAREKSNSNEIIKISKLITNKQLTPCIIFSFSKSNCEEYAMKLKDIDFNSCEEKEVITTIFDNAIKTLSEQNRNLNMVRNMLPLLLNGVGIHHSGLLPILKEITEILFQEGKIKVLLTTETFAMGVNMPAKTVVFTSIEKFDGSVYRFIRGGEYIQMSGRAGRRGIDEAGYVVIMLDKKLNSSAAKEILLGKPDPINSAFKLSYNMLLNVHRFEDIDINQLINKSFYHFQTEGIIAKTNAKIKKTKLEKSMLVIPNRKAIVSYMKLQDKINAMQFKIKSSISTNVDILPYIVPGRLLHIADNEVDWGWGIALNYYLKDTNNRESLRGYLIDIILYVDSYDSLRNPLPTSLTNETGIFEIYSCKISTILEISTIQIKVTLDISTKEKVSELGTLMKSILSKHSNKPPILDPITELKIDDPLLLIELSKLKALRQEFNQLSSPASTEVEAYLSKQLLRKKLIKYKSKAAEFTLAFSSEQIRYMTQILNNLDYVDSNTLKLKGKVSCCIEAADELITTELLFSKAFNQINAKSIAALCSCLVLSEEKAEATSNSFNDTEIESAYKLLKEAAEKIALVKQSIQPQFEYEAYMASLKTDLMLVTYKWCEGSSFNDICRHTEIYEGVIIKCFKRIAELLEQLIEASKIIGNNEYVSKFEEALRLLKRDIAFANSLYL